MGYCLIWQEVTYFPLLLLIVTWLFPLSHLNCLKGLEVQLHIILLCSWQSITTCSHINNLKKDTVTCQGGGVSSKNLIQIGQPRAKKNILQLRITLRNSIGSSYQLCCFNDSGQCFMTKWPYPTWLIGIAWYANNILIVCNCHLFSAVYNDIGFARKGVYTLENTYCPPCLVDKYALYNAGQKKCNSDSWIFCELPGRGRPTLKVVD